MDARHARGRPTRPPWGLRAAGTAALTAAVVGSGLSTTPASAAPDPTVEQLAAGGSVHVIVEGAPDAAAAAVERLGGAVETRLSVVDGLSARVPAATVADLLRVPGVRAVTPDSSLQVLGEKWGDDTTKQDEKASAETGKWEADKDLGSSNRIAKATGTESIWDKERPGRKGERLTGTGVGVALLDTGVTPVAGLADPGKVVNGADLSMDSQIPGDRYLDGYGHGTHMAGLIAGRDAAPNNPGQNKKKENFAGMAPDATIVNVKVGAGDGSVDVSQVIAGIDWVVTHRREHNIRVMNLSYGTESTQSYVLDPLAHAVESAWHAGIVVVVAAGNDGQNGPSPLTMPAADPYVLAVGSTDHRGRDKADDWRVGAWTNSGTDARRPDLVVPGKSVVSLRAPGSLADVTHPEGLVTGDARKRFFRGTGTSQSAAIVSGAVALLLQRNPELTPDQIKALLMASAAPLKRDPSPVQGAGLLDMDEALKLLKDGAVPAVAQSWPRSTGLGSLEAARGDSHLVDPQTGIELRGEQDIFGVAWDAGRWAAAASKGAAWTGGTWRGTRWLADDGSPTVWTGKSWSGTAWRDQPWDRLSWRAADWSRLSWRGSNWSRLSWRDADGW
jgi:serine protease AprX